MGVVAASGKQGMDDRACIGTCASRSVVGQSNAGELPARRRREEVAIRGPYMGGRRGHLSPAEHHLVAHALAVVLAEGAGEGMEARIRKISADGPLPDVAEKLFHL